MSASFCRQFVPAQEAHLSFTKTRLCKHFFPFILFTAPKVVTFNLSGNKYYKKPLVYSFYAFSPHIVRPVKKPWGSAFDTLATALRSNKRRMRPPGAEHHRTYWLSGYCNNPFQTMSEAAFRHRDNAVVTTRQRRCQEECAQGENFTQFILSEDCASTLNYYICHC